MPRIVGLEDAIDIRLRNRTDVANLGADRGVACVSDDVRGSRFRGPLTTGQNEDRQDPCGVEREGMSRGAECSRAGIDARKEKDDITSN